MKLGAKESKPFTVIATPGKSERAREISFVDMKIIGNGSFGVVYQAKLCESSEVIAIKKVLQDKRFKNRELQIMRSIEHQNVIALKYFFYSNGDKKDDVYLNLVLEFLPETVYRVSKNFIKQKQTMPILHVKLYMYQMFRALGYIHNCGICHRDIKPQNLLLDPGSGVLKLIDFGSAKHLQHGEPNVSYICSRYYRAPELIFGATNYGCHIDVWSAGCVVAELLLGKPMFPGETGVDQLVEIIKVLGSPTRQQISEMNPNYTEFKFPNIKGQSLSRVFSQRTPSEAIDLLSQVLQYSPQLRPQPMQVCAMPFFDELRSDNAQLPGSKQLPPLFNFSNNEIKDFPDLHKKLIPPHYAKNSIVEANATVAGAAAAAGAASATN